jgi:hypothetical protein
MKLSALIVALGLTAGAAFAQTATPAAPATPATPATPAAAATKTTVTTTTKTEVKDKAVVKKAKKKTAKKAVAKKPTQSMGAGRAAIETDLGAADRRARIDAAYANWKAGAR